MLLLAFTISGMGLLIASLLKSLESFGLLMQLLILPMFFLSGAFFPLTAVPGWMKFLSMINPLSYGVDAMREMILRSQAGSAGPFVLPQRKILRAASGAGPALKL